MAVIGGVDRKSRFFKAGLQQVLGGLGVFENENTHGNLLGKGVTGCLQ
jgi:hypothetical protein